MINIKLGAGAVGAGARAGATSYFSSGSIKMMRLIAAPAQQQWTLSSFLRKTLEYHDDLIMNKMLPVSLIITIIRWQEYIL
jgi:hypothetical protein